MFFSTALSPHAGRKRRRMRGLLTFIFMKPRLIILSLIILSACASPADKKNVVVKNGELNIAYRSAGNSDTAIVFVHGWCINKEYWTAQEDYFSKRFNTVTLDLGGHGQSGKNRNNWTIDEYGNDVAAVINTLDLKKVILVGHSMGGDIILNVANKVPEKIIGFIGVDNFKSITTNFSPEEQKQVDTFFIMMKSGYKAIAEQYTRSSLFPANYADTVSVKRVINDIKNSDSSIAIQTLESLMQVFLKEGELLSQLKVPVHLISSDLEPMNEESVKKYCKAGLFVHSIKGVGHYPMIEKPEEFNKLMDEAIGQIAKK
ncbi:MAG: alpha/beta hydrolase [Chitinophagaceae bacterium]|nr:alpha/beta hydrolase [Chitinophagaceae bacterium]